MSIEKSIAIFCLLLLTVSPGTAEGQAPQSPLRKKEINLDSQTGNLPPPVPLKPGETAQDPKKPLKPTVSGLRQDARIIEKFQIQRVPIFPDDPESAWWEANPRVAFAVAQREQRPLLLLFTADWNAKCLSLSEEVFTTKTFSDYVKENVVVCYLNYGRSRTDNPDAMRLWKEKFKVHGYPNLLVFDPEGNVVQEVTGYKTGRPVTYFNELKNVVQPVINASKERKEELLAKGFRNWRNNEGRLLFARFVKWGGELVTLQSADRREWTIELSTLSEDDRKFVRSFPTAGEIADGNGVGR